MMLPFIILCLVFLLIAFGQVFRLPLAIWQIMAASAIIMIATLQISPLDAFFAIDWQVIVFLAGMFILGEGLSSSGLIAAFCHQLLWKIRDPRQVLLAFMLMTGALSALVTNDTIAVIATPVALLLSKHFGIRVRVPLLALALSITLGSALSPLGNPQNLLVALDPAIKAPFNDFLWWLGIPSVIGLFAAWGLLVLLFRSDLNISKGNISPHTAQVPDRPHTHGRLALLSKIGMIIILVLIAWRIVATLFHLGNGIPLWAISVCAAAPLLIAGHRHRLSLLKRMDWQTLVFFAALFISVRTVWNHGVIQNMIAGMQLDLASPAPLFAACLLFSQIVSNVPLVSLFLPVLGQIHAPTGSYLVLAAASTIAGNLTILGAASNVIIIQQARRENRNGETFGFIDMIRIGVPLTLVCSALYFGWWTLIH